MTLKTRRVLLILFTIFFLIASAVIILYSTGWRLDIKTLSVKKTGGIYIETSPKYVSIKINGEDFLDNSGILKNGTLISNLIPKNYKIEISKGGYFPYYKEIKIEPSMVSELIGIILIPEKLEEKNILPIKLKGEEIVDLANNKIIIKNTKNKINYLYNLSNGESSLNINAAFNNLIKTSAISKIIFHPIEKNKLLIEANNSIYSLDIEKIKLEEIKLQITAEKNQTAKLSYWIAKNHEIYYAVKKTDSKSKTDFFQLSSLNLITKTNTDFGDLKISGLKEIKISNDNNKILIIDDLNRFRIFNLQTKELAAISENTLSLVQSFDNKKIAFLDKENEINVYFLENWYKNSPQKAGETIKLNSENNKKIKNISWYKDSYHLFIEYENEEAMDIDFTEIDSRNHLNQYSIVKKIKTAYYEAASETLYFIKNEKLYSLKI